VLRYAIARATLLPEKGNKIKHMIAAGALQIRYWQTEQEDAIALRARANNENLKCTLAERA
jgi:hypothetical protein